MIGRPLRMEWHETDTPAALKETYLSQRDVGVRTRLHAAVADTQWLADQSGG